MYEGLGRAHGVNSGQKTTNPLQHTRVIKLRSSAPTAGRHAKAKSLVVVQRAAIQNQRAYYWHLGGHQFGGECVFFINLCVAPAFRPVKLGHDNIARCVGRPYGAFKVNLVDPVFVARQRHQAPITQ